MAVPWRHAGWAMTGPDEGRPAAWAGAEGPVLVYRDDTGAQRFFPLEGTGLADHRARARAATSGWPGTSGCRGCTPRSTSSAHDWTIVDDGLSRNGTFLNGERLTGRRRLRDGDTFVLGSTSFRFRDTSRETTQLTKVGEQVVTAASLSPTQRQIVIALCRPYKHDDPYATPASNQRIADELFLSVDAVKTHLRILFQKFGIEDLPQNQKRVKLVERVLGLGLISRKDL